MPEETEQVQPQAPSTPALNTGAERIIEGAIERQEEGKHTLLGANHLLLELIMPGTTPSGAQVV